MSIKIRNFVIYITIILTSLQIFPQDCLAFSLFGHSSQGRDYIYITGSSTISPLMATMSEEFSRVKNMNNYGDKMFPTPIVESTGTGDGFRDFCKGRSLKYPDFVNASRPINKREIYLCKDNGVIDIAKIKIGYDGIIIGNNIGRKTLKITKEQLFLALARKIYDKRENHLINNPYKKWSDIDPSLPNRNIKIFGPPKSSGTRDVFLELVMRDYCRNSFRLIQHYPNKESFDKNCPTIREDGVFIESGENDNLIIKKLKENPDSFGIFGYDFLVMNKNKIHPAMIDGVSPSSDTIFLKQYSLSRPLYVYFKINNLKRVPQMKEFIKEIIDENTIGKRGYLIHHGLIPLGEKEFKKVRKETLEIINSH
ncbi:MAG: substrate-binding domain-containing protein [Rickettsiales bacterium]|nr:substrate-binding domain-containing protein [Rickettsiales bacterium]